MRKIKFRAWDNGQMHEVSFNNLYCNNNHPSGQLILREEKSSFGGYIPTVLMQYTGLEDSNGKEIYESDLCKTANSRIGEVKFGFFEDCETDSNYIQEVCGWYLDIPNYGQVCLDSRTEGWCEVIGNIYEKVKE